ncbi:MAG TPA: hypothetical protein VII56_14790 [Rhizomicrobium sp.]
MLAGASITGISGLYGWTLVGALGAGAFGLLCVFIAIGIMLRLLTSESFFLSQIDEKKFANIKQRLVAHQDDILSPVFKDLDNFLRLRREAMADIRRDCKTDAEAADQAEALEFFPKIAGQTVRILSLAHFEVLRDDLTRREPLLFALAVGAIVGIGAFAVITGQHGKGKADETVSVVGQFGPAIDRYTPDLGRPGPKATVSP